VRVFGSLLSEYNSEGEREDPHLHGRTSHAKWGQPLAAPDGTLSLSLSLYVCVCVCVCVWMCVCLSIEPRPAAVISLTLRPTASRGDGESHEGTAVLHMSNAVSPSRRNMTASAATFPATICLIGV